MAEPKWKSAPKAGSWQDAPTVAESTAPPVQAGPSTEPAQKVPAPEQGRGILSEVMKGMTQGGPPVAVARGLYASIPSLMEAQNKFIEGGAYKAGGAITDLAAQTGLPPEVSGGLGYATNVALQAAPSFIAGAITKPLAAPIQATSKRMMQSALKPTINDLKSGKAAIAIDTMLEEGFNPTKRGVEQMRSRINDLNFEIKTAIANSPETVNKGEVGKRLIDTFNKFKNQVNPNADLDAIRSSWLEFRNHPLLAGKTDIPVQIAQELKSGTYRQLAKKYGEMGAASVEAQKQIARGLKEEISRKVPKVAGLNARESKLISTLDVAERRALQDANKNPMGLSLLASHPAAAIGFLADRNAWVKSMLARLLYSGSEVVPVTAGRVAGGLLGYASGRSMDREHGH